MSSILISLLEFHSTIEQLTLGNDMRKKVMDTEANISHALKSFIEKCISLDPNERPTVGQCIAFFEAG